MQAGEVERDSRFTISTDSVNRQWEYAAFACMHVADNGHESVAIAVIVNNQSIGRSWQPMQHSSLLPIPRSRLRERYPAVIIGKVYKPDCSAIIGRRWTVNENRF
jgi:hypothetical protein